MAEITIPEPHEEQFEQIREELEAAFVDTYGRVRKQDVIEYLLDTYTPPDEPGVTVFSGNDPIASATYSDLQQVASDIPNIPGSGIEADEMRGQLISELGTVELAHRLTAIEEPAEEQPAGHTPDGDSNSEAGTTSAAPSMNSGDGSVENERDGEAVSIGRDDAPSDSAADSSGDTGDALSAANQLLEAHADKWSETETGDEPYEVELPDGSTEAVRTKDDIRRLLFKNY